MNPKDSRKRKPKKKDHSISYCN